MDANFGKRVAFAAVAIPLALLFVWHGGFVLALLLGAVTLLGTRELFHFAERQGLRPLTGFGMVTAAGFPSAVYLGLRIVPDLDGWATAAAGLWVVLLLGWTLAARPPTARPLASAAVTALAVLYAAVLPSFLLTIRHTIFPVRSWAGTTLVFAPLVITWVVDTAAMLGGRTFGGPKLWPTVSPGKTWSGAVCGVIGGVAAAVLLNRLALAPYDLALSLGAALTFGVVLSVVGQIGDLAESNFKREVGVKDSSALIPGHGGVLDRLDSLYFVIPVAAALYRLFGVL